MTKNEKLKQIREAVDIALEAQGLESTRALVARCELLNSDAVKYILISKTINRTPIERDCEYRFQIMLKRSREYLASAYGDTTPNGYIILGRDITLEDCLAVLKKKRLGYAIDDNGEFIHLFRNKEGRLMPYWEGKFWKPTIPLHLQKDSTIDFIHNLIVNNK